MQGTQDFIARNLEICFRLYALPALVFVLAFAFHMSEVGQFKYIPPDLVSSSIGERLTAYAYLSKIISLVRGDECFDVQLVLLSRATSSISSVTCWPLTSLAAKGTKLLLPLEMRKVACGNS